jgi:hypothetical protein
MMIGLASGKMESLPSAYPLDRAEVTKSDAYKLNYLYILPENHHLCTPYSTACILPTPAHNIYHRF